MYETAPPVQPQPGCHRRGAKREDHLVAIVLSGGAEPPRAGRGAGTPCSASASTSCQRTQDTQWRYVHPPQSPVHGQSEGTGSGAASRISPRAERKLFSFFKIRARTVSFGRASSTNTTKRSARATGPPYHFFGAERPFLRLLFTIRCGRLRGPPFCGAGFRVCHRAACLCPAPAPF